MCGFSGFLSSQTSPYVKDFDVILSSMGQTLVHRGPDVGGVWFDSDSGIGFSHQRLSIVDISSAGNQPMISEGGKFVIAFNGEIYNHQSLRKELEAQGVGPKWRGHSDTETLLACFEIWGIENTLKKTIGMFSFSAWCVESKMLILARDRLGEKPLYFGWQNSGGRRVFMFGSELKALKVHPGFEGEINRSSLSLMLRFGYIPAPYSIYRGIEKLPPGHILTISMAKPNPKISSYWDLKKELIAATHKPFSGSFADATNQLEALLKDAIKLQMLADVPLGAFLSGGVDSSTIVSLMQAQSSAPIKTFTIGFNSHQFNEAYYASKVAEHLKTDHTELYITPHQASEIVFKLPAIYDEPFADCSQIPTYLVSKLASNNVKVALSGDGGDEIFCGYNRYKFTHEFWPILKAIPLPFRRGASRFIDAATGKKSLDNKIFKITKALEQPTVKELYLSLVSHWGDPNSLVINGWEPNTLITDEIFQGSFLSDVQGMMFLDMISYLPDDILVKVDRAAMSVSLENRAPFLDHRITEFVATLPFNFKLRKGETKSILREVLYRYVPKELIERPKMGFGVPIGQWLRGPLKDWAENLLEEKRLNQEGFLNSNLVRNTWAEHLSGKRNWEGRLWNILMFQAWLEVEKK